MKTHRHVQDSPEVYRLRQSILSAASVVQEIETGTPLREIAGDLLLEAITEDRPRSVKLAGELV